MSAAVAMLMPLSSTCALQFTCFAKDRGFQSSVFVRNSVAVGMTEGQISTETPPDAVARRLILLLHAKSSWENRSLRDHDRPLSKSGRADAVKLSQKFKEMGWVPELILSSDAQRTRETLKIMQEQVQGFLEARVHFISSFYSVAAMDGQTAEHLQQAICRYSGDEILTIMFCACRRLGSAADAQTSRQCACESVRQQTRGRLDKTRQVARGGLGSTLACGSEGNARTDGTRPRAVSSGDARTLGSRWAHTLCSRCARWYPVSAVNAQAGRLLGRIWAHGRAARFFFGNLERNLENWCKKF